MICENCGAEIKNRESYCPNCGMEIISPYSKSIKARYMAGEYRENEGNYTPRNRRNREKEVYVEETEAPFVEETDPDAVEEYYEPEEYYESGGISVLTAIIIFLIVALLIGFVIGILVFSGFLHSLPGFSNIK